jgi:hypothetical protein
MKTIPIIICRALAAIALACFALSPTARAVNPPPDGGYPDGNTATRREWLGTPILRDMRTLFTERLPRGPVAIHLTENEWGKMSRDIPTSQQRIREGAKGLIVMKDPFGSYLAFFACAGRSGEGVACVPEIIKSFDKITFGQGCFCFRGHDPVHKPVAQEQESCSPTFSRGLFECKGTCWQGRKCQAVKITTTLPGGTFLTCVCQ